MQVVDGRKIRYSSDEEFYAHQASGARPHDRDLFVRDRITKSLRFLMYGGTIDHSEPKVERHDPCFTKDIKFLDVGCRDGWSLSYLRNDCRDNLMSRGKGFTDLLGIELCHETVDYARSKKRNVMQGDIRKDCLGDDQFDVIYCSHCLEHLDLPLDAVKNIARMLKPSGTLLCVVPLEHEDLDEKKKSRHAFQFREKDASTELLNDAGMDVLQSFCVRGHNVKMRKYWYKIKRKTRFIADEIWVIATKRKAQVLPKESTAKVSVIIPTYNRADVVLDAVNSVLSQTHFDMELLVIDDGSTDDTGVAIEGLDDPRVQYYYKDNAGVSSARNYGMTKASGEYIAFLDSDDIWPSDFLEALVGSLENSTGYSVAYCMRTLLYPDGTSKESYQEKHFRTGWLSEDIFKKSFIQTSALCFKREILAGLAFEESLANAEDTDMWLNVSTRTPFLFVPDIQIVYREGFNLISRQAFSSQLCNRIRVLERFYFGNGKEYIARRVAIKKLSSAYESVAKKSGRDNCRAASICLYKKAISYCPWRIRLYLGLVKTFLIDKGSDIQPGWQMPKSLPAESMSE